ncbi:MAG: hypothetical protein CVU74_05315, partial [Deltaproteobacteria bacterium HGW-Deltaproteobacteria-9]
MNLHFRNLVFIFAFTSLCLSGCGHTIDKKHEAAMADTSDYEQIYEEADADTTETDMDDDLLLRAAGNRSHRPVAGTAARTFYDRLAYIMGNLRQTKYVHYKKKQLDEDNGIYEYDCSGFIGEFILEQALPKHYRDLADNAKKFHDEKHPRAWGFYDYFNKMLADKDENSNSYWRVFKSLEKIQPGDIIVVKYDEKWQKSMIDKCKHSSTGHVMTAWSYPVKSGDEYWIYVIDSSGSGHAKDTRRTKFDNVNAESGIGKGKMWYGVNSKDKRPVYYRWSSAGGCQYTLRDMSTNCKGKDEDLCCKKEKGKTCSVACSP